MKPRTHHRPGTAEPESDKGDDRRQPQVRSRWLPGSGIRQCSTLFGHHGNIIHNEKTAGDYHGNFQTLSGRHCHSVARKSCSSGTRPRWARAPVDGTIRKPRFDREFYGHFPCQKFPFPRLGRFRAELVPPVRNLPRARRSSA